MNPNFYLNTSNIFEAQPIVGVLNNDRTSSLLSKVYYSRRST